MRLVARLRDDRGSVLVAAGVMAAAFVLLGAVVVEVGQWLSHRRHIQVRADAAALAGGQVLAECFNVPTFVSEATADTDIENAAKDYGGLTSNKNIQGLDQGAGESSLMSFQGNKYPDQQGVTRDLGNECFNNGNPNLMLDVKMAETGIPKFFGFSPLETVHGWARVQLQQIKSLTPSLPFAIPDVRIQHVAVTFVNNATGLALAGCSNGCVFQLTPPAAPSGGLDVWTSTATIPMPAANTNVGMRVGLGTTVGSCASNITPTTYTCFDDNSNVGLVALRAYDATAGGSQGSPILRAVTPTTCSGTPFFSDYQATGGACSYGVTATVDWGNSGPPTGAAVRATVNGTNLTLARSGNTNTWVSTDAVTLNTLQGPYPVTMSWCVSNCTAKKATFTPFVAGNPPVQQIFSGSDSPILAAQVLDRSDNSAFYSFPQNQNASLAVAVGLSTGVHLPVRCSNGTSGGSYSCATDPPVLLRSTSANGSNDSLTLAINCGGANLRDDIENGCSQSFSLNTQDICPDPANPNPTDCATSRNGGSVGQLQQGMNFRFTVNNDSTTCDPNNYPNYQPGELDPRAVTLIITDWNAFSTSGQTLVPVVTFATFYVTGWDGAPRSCNGVNEPAPAGDTKKASVWGHYIADVNLGAVPNGTVCVGPGQTPGVTPCAIALTR